MNKTNYSLNWWCSTHSSSNKYRQLATPKRLQCFLALTLGSVTMDGVCRIAFLVEKRVKLVGALFCLDKHQRQRVWTWNIAANQMASIPARLHLTRIKMGQRTEVCNWSGCSTHQMHLGGQGGRNVCRTPPPRQPSGWCSRWCFQRVQPQGRCNHGGSHVPTSSTVIDNKS